MCFCSHELTFKKKGLREREKKREKGYKGYRENRRESEREKGKRKRNIESGRENDREKKYLYIQSLREKEGVTMG